jgi:predicted small lipoprotein YifL
MVTCSHSKLLVFTLLIMALCFGSLSCGKKGPPKLPRRQNPPAVIDLSYRIEDQQAELTWTVPRKDKRHQDELAGFKVYRSKVTLSEADCESCPLKFNVVGDIPVLKKDEPEQMQFSDALDVGYRYVYFLKGYSENQMISPESNYVEFVH